MVRKIWQKTYILRGQKSFATNADYRTRNYITPSRGKESYKDSYIWVSFISLLNKLQPTEICYFFTANPADLQLIKNYYFASRFSNRNASFRKCLF